MAATRFIRWFHDISMADVGLVGGKNASLGELCRELSPRGISVPNGFAITAAGYRHVLHVGGLAQQGVDVWINTPRRPREACARAG
jgi:pyruvate,water dikinase